MRDVQGLTAPAFAGAVPFHRIITPRRVHARRHSTPLGVIGICAVLVGMLLLTLPLTVGTLTLPKTVSHYQPTSDAADTRMLKRAAAYDRRLLADGSTTMGEAMDPFSGSQAPAYLSDQEYMSLLGSGDRMASISIPKIGVNLDVGHGTGAGTLEMGAGHIYGTTLPVGDPGNSVIAAHRGLGVKLLFYRLGELSAGDMIYTQAAGRTVAWKVDHITRVDPGSDMERDILEPEGNRTLLTLYTCDPPGLNTRRLIVRAHRVPYVDAASVPGQTDWLTPVAIAGVNMVVGLVLTMIATPVDQVKRHYSGHTAS